MAGGGVGLVFEGVLVFFGDGGAGDDFLLGHGMGPVEELSLETRLPAAGIRFANGGRESLDEGWARPRSVRGCVIIASK